MNDRFYLELVAEQRNHGDERICGDVFLSRKIIEENRTIGVLSDAGIQGTLAGTSLRAILLRLTAPTTEAQKAFREIGVTVFDTQGKFLGLEKSLQLINKRTKDLSQQARQRIFPSN